MTHSTDPACAGIANDTRVWHINSWQIQAAKDTEPGCLHLCTADPALPFKHQKVPMLKILNPELPAILHQTNTVATKRSIKTDDQQIRSWHLQALQSRVSLRASKVNVLLT